MPPSMKQERCHALCSRQNGGLPVDREIDVHQPRASAPRVKQR